MAHIYAYTGKSRGAKTEIQAEQVQWVFGGPQASSCELANIVVVKASLGAFKQCSCLLS
jgi:hypothetical protein